jgi:hypothetical protein
MTECPYPPWDTSDGAGRSEPLGRGGQLCPWGPGHRPHPCLQRVCPDDGFRRVSFHSASISPSNRATFPRASGCIVRACR